MCVLTTGFQSISQHQAVSLSRRKSRPVSLPQDVLGAARGFKKQVNDKRKEKLSMNGQRRREANEIRYINVTLENRRR